MTTPHASHPATPDIGDIVATSAGRLEAAQDLSDLERLRVLDELYAGLEAELEKDFEQAGPAGR